MSKQAFLALLLTSLSFFITSPALAKRIALVIGNDDYANVTKLQKAVNDAKAVSSIIRDIGFEVIESLNANRRTFDQQLNDLNAKVNAGDEVLFFFAGHGISVRGRNYLLPIDIPKITPGQERSVTKEAFSEDEIISLLQERGAKVSLLIIDACRNNPFPKEGTRSVGRSVGLGQRSTPPRNTFVMYSAGFGQEALDRLSEDDQNPNSIFTRKLLPLLKTPGLSHIQMAKQLQIEVEQLALTTKSKHQQFPAFYDQVRGDFFLVPGKKDKAKIIGTPSISADATLWKTIENSNKASDFEFYLSKFPKGKYSIIAKLKLQKLSISIAPKTTNIQFYIENVYLKEKATFTKTVNYNELGLINNTELHKKIRKYKKRWPIRIYTLIPGSIRLVKKSSEEKTVVFKFKFFVSRPKKNVKGTGKIMLTLVPYNNTFLVSTVKEINEIEK